VDLQAERRLRDLAVLRRARDAPGLDDRDKLAKLMQFHKNALHAPVTI
jgi:hypothetical protein